MGEEQIGLNPDIYGQSLMHQIDILGCGHNSSISAEEEAQGIKQEDVYG